MDEQPLYSLMVYVRDPERLLFSGQVESITSYNDKGLFDVLPIHENFITIIHDKVIVRPKGGIKEFPLTKGILKVEENEVQIFLNAERI